MRLSVVIGTGILAAALAAPGALAQTPAPMGPGDASDQAKQAMDQANKAMEQAQRAMDKANVKLVQLRADGPYLGIGVQDIDSDSAKKFNLKEVRGVEITSVAGDSPAAKAGLKQGDVILEFNGQAVEGGEQLTRMVRETPVGRQVKIGVWRNGGMQTLTATIEAHKGPVGPNGEGWNLAGPQMQELQNQLRNLQIPQFRQSPDFFGFPMGSPMLGIMGEPLGQEKQLAEFFGVEDGVLVKSVNRDSAAEKAGIKAGDVIVRVDDAKVATSRDITMALRSARNKKTVTVIVVRNKKEMPVTVTLENPGVGGIAIPVRAGLWLPDERVL